MYRTDSEFRQGTLIRGIGSFYTVLAADQTEWTVRCKKKFRHQHLSPLVGDEILFSPGQGEEHGWIEEILPRKTECVRPPVANVDSLLIVIAPVPEPDMVLVDRLLVQAYRQNMRAAIVVNKADLDPEMPGRVALQYARAGIPVLAESNAEKKDWLEMLPPELKTLAGDEALRAWMTGGLNCLTGQSGVGKTTLLNHLLQLDMETGEISKKISRGKNTTRHAELLARNGLRVLDTAGFSLLEFESVFPPLELKEAWAEFHELEGRCRFDPCYHDREPGCAVTAAVESGALNRQRVERYRQLLNESRTLWKERYDR